MNSNLLLFVLTLINYFFAPRHNVQLGFMRAQLKILRNRIPAERIVPTPEEKAELIRIGALMDHDIADLLSIVQPKTYHRWLRELRQGKPFRKPGQPPAARELRKLIVRMARENVAWGYRRIAGEFKKLGIAIGATTIRDVLNASDMHPAPDKAGKKPPLPWPTFVHAHMESLVATDFFTKRIYTYDHHDNMNPPGLHFRTDRGYISEQISLFFHVRDQPSPVYSLLHRLRLSANMRCFGYASELLASCRFWIPFRWS